MKFQIGLKSSQLNWFTQDVISQIRLTQVLGNGWKARAQAAYEEQQLGLPKSEKGA